MSGLFMSIIFVSIFILAFRTGNCQALALDTNLVVVTPSGPDDCRPILALNSTRNCTLLGKYFYYDPQNRTCREYEDCVDGRSKFSSMKTCLDACRKKSTKRCQPQLKGKAPERCRWIRATTVTLAGCPKYQLQCDGGPCTTRPCKAPCEICTYNLEFTIRNCSLITRLDGDGAECPPPFRCERDIRCKTDDLQSNAVTTRVTTIHSTPMSTRRLSMSTPKFTATSVSMITAKSVESRSTTPVSTTKSQSVSIHATTHSNSMLSPTTTMASVCVQSVKYVACSTQDVDARMIWYFDTQSKICRQFHGGETCSGNANGFRTKEECVRVCQIHQDCPPVVRNPLPLGCRYEERRALDGCLTLAMLCTDKPGRCPVPTGKVSYNICYKECDRDADCKDEMKCCANGCATLCLAPAPPLLPLSKSNSTDHPHHKAGACPKENARKDDGGCAEKCNMDDDCHGAKKCCNISGCGQICRSPIEASPMKPSGDPCSNNPCLPYERCTPISPSSFISKRADVGGYVCEPIENFAAFDPCINGKSTCTEGEQCIYEPQLCLTGPCPQYRCVSSTTASSGSRRKDSDGSNVKRKAEITPPDSSNDPCLSSPCRACQRCVRTDPISNRNAVIADAKQTQFRCENDCPGQCEECAINGRCVVIRQPFVCRTNQAIDPCQNRTCEAYPDTNCIVDPCHCLRARFVLDNGAEITSDECRSKHLK